MLIKYFISDRFGGVSKPPYSELNIALHTGDDPEDVIQNRKILFQKAGIKKAQFADQIHSNKVIILDKYNNPPQCDGFITTKSNLALAIMSADCFGVLLYDPINFIIGAVHAGRAGAQQGIVINAIEIMYQLGAQEIRAIISPGIHSCCYEVGEEILQKTPSRFIKKDRFLDIKAMIYEQLHKKGVSSIEDLNICTCCDHRYYSYRRERRTGRFASIIWMEE
ncbi:polyphenol oxidase [Nitratiruptor sp. YY08-26]|uniref:peptidoglycan editing factor PgeF n=1 Tax=unclassified Nitratiruptor TaxID=2624044 RepID=UPI001915D7E0|nr:MULTISPECIES: peptidoglycan editing factor PgeF [unclassified Nitratiruptor]BCD61235.1 polyphenol oxidase [Nitratiruptor sp. YY08-13]BCD65168.1 polyphenol oxidase [Nitratiruptor sp. YY08-26]